MTPAGGETSRRPIRFWIRVNYIRGKRSTCRVKARMGATHFLMKRLPNVASEMALHFLAYNLTRVLNIMGVRLLMAAI